MRKLMDYYWSEKSFSGYTAINDILGALAGALMEFNRRIVVNSLPEEMRRKMLAGAMSKIVNEFYEATAAPLLKQLLNANGDIFPI